MPRIGPLHISLNGQETLFDKFRDLFEIIYTKLFCKNTQALAYKPNFGGSLWGIALYQRIC